MAQESFTVPEIKKYLESKDSLGDIHYFLSAENIEKANYVAPCGADKFDANRCADCELDCKLVDL